MSKEKDREPDVRIPPHETEGSWSIGEREKKTKKKRAGKTVRETTPKKTQKE